MADTVETVATLVRAVGDDRDVNFLATADQMAFINAGWREFQRRLAVKGSPIMKATTTIDLPIGTIRVDATTTPPLPTDFSLPYYIEEHVTGSTDEYIEVKEREWPPTIVQDTYLRWWAWESNGLNFVGATQTITIRMKYGKVLPALTVPSSVIPVPLAADAIAWCVLFQVALSRGASADYRDRSDQMAERYLEELMSIHVKREQRLPRRRRPHSAGRF